MSRCQTVKICNIVEIDDSNIVGVLQDILTTLQGELTVNPNAAWQAIFEAALNNAEIALDADTLAALENITVVVDTTGGPVEITGTVTVDSAGGIDVNVLNTPLDVNVSNWAELLASTLNVTLNGEVVNVQLSQEQIDALVDVDDTDDDLRPVNVHCFEWQDGESQGTFIGWANAAEDGSFASYTVISGDAPPQTATVMCQSNAVTSIAPITLEQTCALAGGENVVVTPVALIDTGSQTVVGNLYLDRMGNAIAGDVLPADECDCPVECCPDETVVQENAFPLDGADLTANSKYNLDDPTFTNAYADIGTQPWTAADLAASLNANSASAVPPTVPSGIDYSSTVWADGVSSAGVPYVYVVSGPVPTTIDLVSQSVSIPVDAI